MRIRTVKPELLDDEKVSRLSHAAFRLFLGVILLADDHGNLRGALDFLQGRVFHSTSADVAAALAELIEAGLVRPYLVRQQAFLAVTGWAKHQKITRPSRPHIPGPNEGDDSTPLDARWRWMTPPAVRAGTQEEAHADAAREVEEGMGARENGMAGEPGEAAAELPRDGAESSVADVPVRPSGDSDRPAAATEQRAATAPLTALQALAILAEAAGPRLSIHPPGHPNPGTASGATPKAEELFRLAWEPLQGLWGAEHLRALGQGIGNRVLWRHLAGAVSMRFLIDHLEEGLQQATGLLQQTAAPAPRPQSKTWSRKDAAPPADPRKVEGDMDKGLETLAGVVSPELLQTLRIVRDDDFVHEAV